MSIVLEQACKIKTVEIETPMGEHINDMYFNANVTALTHKADVVFWHNEREYKVHYEDLIACVQTTGVVS